MNSITLVEVGVIQFGHIEPTRLVNPIRRLALLRSLCLLGRRLDGWRVRRLFLGLLTESLGGTHFGMSASGSM